MSFALAVIFGHLSTIYFYWNLIWFNQQKREENWSRLGLKKNNFWFLRTKFNQKLLNFRRSNHIKPTNLMPTLETLIFLSFISRQPSTIQISFYSRNFLITLINLSWPLLSFGWQKLFVIINQQFYSLVFVSLLKKKLFNIWTL